MAKKDPGNRKLDIFCLFVLNQQPARCGIKRHWTHTSTSVGRVCDYRFIYFFITSVFSILSFFIFEKFIKRYDKQTYLSFPTACQPKCFFHGQYEQWCKNSWFCLQGTWRGQLNPSKQMEQILLFVMTVTQELLTCVVSLLKERLDW